MSKKAGKNHNHNRPRRTILPARGTTIQIGWAQYNESHRSKGRRYAERMWRVADTVRGILGIPQDRRDRRVSAILIAIVKSENLSCWGPVRRFDKRPEDLERRGLYGPYSRAQYQLRVSIMPKAQQEILARMAGEEAVHGANTVDFDGYGMAPYKEWQNAEYGRLGVQDFTELRVIHAPHGKTCAATATPGNANGSPYPRKMIRIIPDGSGGVAGGAAYGGIKNRNAIRDGGRRAAMDPKSDATPKGFNARAEMPGFGGERPRTLCSMLRIGNNVESPFSAMERFGRVVRALKPHTQAVELPLMRICHYTPIWQHGLRMKVKAQVR